MSHLLCQLIARGVRAHRPPRVVVTAEGTLGVPEHQLSSVDSMGHAQTAVSAPWEGQGEIVGPSHKAMAVQGCRSLEGQGTFFWPSLLCHPRAGPPIITHVTNPAPSVPTAVLGPARSLIRKGAFPFHSNLPIHHPWLQAWAGVSLVASMPHTGCPTLPGSPPSHPHNHSGAEAAQKQEN